METMIGIGSILAVIAVITFSRYMRSHDDARPGQAMPDTLGLMLNTLRAIGCQPTKDSDDSLNVCYQGENFHIECGGMYCRIWDPMWSGMKADDPQMHIVREAVNSANFSFGPTVVMTAPDNNGIVGLHSRRDIMLHPACPDNTDYVKAVLDSFFATKENFRSCFQQISTARNEADKDNRRPIGFAAPRPED